MALDLVLPTPADDLEPDVDIPLTQVGRVLAEQRAQIKELEARIEFRDLTIQHLRNDRADVVELLFDWQNYVGAATCEDCWGVPRPSYYEPCESCLGTGFDPNERLAGPDPTRHRVRELESVIAALKDANRELTEIVTGSKGAA